MPVPETSTRAAGAGPGSGPTPAAGAPVQISPREFEAFRALIYDTAGIALSDAKRELVQSRLAKRLRALGLRSYGEYFDVVTNRDPSGEERGRMINCITTNKTDFFREPHHFDYLRTEVLVPFVREAARSHRRSLRIWSAACSTGEEPYSIAMTVRQVIPDLAGWDVRIVATDIDTEVLEKASSAVYAAERVAGMPADVLRTNFLKGRGHHAGLFQVKPELRALIDFRQINLNGGAWPVQGPVDVVFCRNVIIYFDRPTQQRLFSRIGDVMRDDGVLMIGHSETLHGICDRFEPLRGTIYLKRGRADGSEPAREHAAPAPAAETPATAAPPAPSPRVQSPPATAPSKRTPARPAVPAASPKPQVRPRRHAAPVAASAADDDAPEHRIEVGGIFASREPAIVSTLLGSCVAACLFDPVAQVGGMNHFLLPDSSDDRGFPTRYGVNAMEVLINEIMKLGGDRRRLQAKVFGAGHVLAGSGMGAAVPDRNAAFVKDFLRRENIPIQAERLGGNSATVVKFHTHSGRARIRTREVVADGTLAARERRFIQQIAKDGGAPHPGDISLF